MKTDIKDILIEIKYSNDIKKESYAEYLKFKTTIEYFKNRISYYKYYYMYNYEKNSNYDALYYRLYSLTKNPRSSKFFYSEYFLDRIHYYMNMTNNDLYNSDIMFINWKRFKNEKI